MCSTRSIRPRTWTGSTLINVGRLVQGRPHLVPCTPSGVIVMLEHYGIAIARSRAVVIGRSEIVGKPMALLLLQRDATVTICHSKTPDLAGSRPRGRHPGGRDRAGGFRDAAVRQARRDGHRRRDQPRDGSLDRARSVRRGLRRAAPISSGAEQSSSAMCIPGLRRSPGRSRPFLAASVRSPSLSSSGTR